MRSAKDFKTIVKTFLSEYPYVTLWQLPVSEDSIRHIHLIGSETKLVLDYPLIESRLKRPEIKSDIARFHATRFIEPYEFISQLSLDEGQLTKFTNNITVLNSDDLPIVEFHHPSELLPDAAWELQESLLEEMLDLEENTRRMVVVPDGKRDMLSNKLKRIFESKRYFMNALFHRP
jgi:hypothetical protein